MVAAIRQVVKVQRGGLIQVRSSRLKVGSEAEVIVLLPDETKNQKRSSTKSNGVAGKATRKVPTARMTKQVRDDISWAKRLQRDPREKPIPYEVVRKRLGLT